MSPTRGPLFWLRWGILGLCIVQLNGAPRTCNSRNCRLPDCFCSGTVIPKGLPVDSIPQIIMLSFDDAINVQLNRYYKPLFKALPKNPNGCEVSATFFVSHRYTQYNMLQTLYHKRHEIADHSITHRYPNTWWRYANYTELDKEIAGQRTIIHRFGNVPMRNIRGFRAPFLQVGGNRAFQVLHDRMFTFDSSLPTLRYQDPPMWPYTFDFPTIQECMMPPCPTGKSTRVDLFTSLKQEGSSQTFFTLLFHDANDSENFLENVNHIFMQNTNHLEFYINTETVEFPC